MCWKTTSYHTCGCPEGVTPTKPGGNGPFPENCTGISSSPPKGSNGCVNNPAGRGVIVLPRRHKLDTMCPKCAAEAKDAQEKKDDVGGGGGQDEGTVKVGA